MRGAHRFGCACARWLGLLATIAGVAAATPAAAQAGTDPIGVHSMLEVNSPYSLMQEMFSEAAKLHAGAIRLDVQPALIFPTSLTTPDYTGLNEITGLAQEYHVPVLADLLSVPTWLASCPNPTAAAVSPRCPPRDLGTYQQMIDDLVSAGTPAIQSWEVWNEPDSPGFFSGTPQQYAGMLRAAYNGIKLANPNANVVLGGISGPSGMSWLDQVFATPQYDAVQAFNTANVHIRTTLDELTPQLVGWRWYFAAHGFNGPLWVTEHGYPADPTYQYDGSYTSGPAAQAAYLSASIPTLLDAGASEVFVTERDNLGGQFASEGLIGGGVDDAGVMNGPFYERPSFSAVQMLIGCYRQLGRDCPGSAPRAAPWAIALPPARIGSSSSAGVTISDPTTDPLRLWPAVLAPGATPGLAVSSDNCPAILEPNETCTVRVQFRPSAGGDAAATIQLASDNGLESVPVRTAAPSVSVLSNTSIGARRFHPINGNGVGYRQKLVFSLRNPIGAAVQIRHAQLAGSDWGQFHVQPGGCQGTDLAPGSSCTLTVVFDPTRVGTSRVNLTLHGDGQPLAAPLAATAYIPPAIVSVSGPAGCLNLRTGQIEVLSTEAGSVDWTLGRVPHASSSCPVAGSGRSTTANGRTSTAAKRVRIDGQSLYAAWVAVHGGLAEGVYQLTTRVHNAHGTSAPRRLRVSLSG